jgi:hypothetical protein
MSSGWGSWRLCSTVIVVTVVVVAAYYRHVIEGLVPAGYDMQTYFFPLRSYVRAALLEGHIPLWTNDLFMGSPILANPQAAVLYPVNLLLMPLEPPKALAVSVVVHVWIAAVGMLLFGRMVMRLGLIPSAIAALAFSLGGAVSAQAGHPNQLATIAWIPLLLWMIELTVVTPRATRDYSLRRIFPILGLAVVVSLQVLAGHPQQFYISLLVGVGYAVLRSCQLLRDRIHTWHSIAWSSGRLLVGLAIGLGFCGFQLLPTLFLSYQSIRAGGLPLHEAGSFSMGLGDLGRAIFPPFTEAPRSQELMTFIGFTGLWLSVLGLGAQHRRVLVVGLVTATSIALLLAMGPELPFFRIAHQLVPGFDLFRVPARWLIVVNLALALLAGLGAERLNDQRKSSGTLLSNRNFCIWLGGILLVGMSSILWGDVSQRTLVVWLVTWIVTGLLVAGIRLWSGHLAFLIIPLLGLELFFATRTLELAVPIPAEAYSNTGHTLETIKADSSGARMLSLADPSYEINDVDRAAYATEYFDRIGEASFRQLLTALKYRDTLTPNLTNAYGRPGPDGYDGGILPLRDYVDFKSVFLPGAETTPDALLRNQLRDIPQKWILDLMGVGYVLVDRKDDIEIDGIFLDTERSLKITGPDRVVLDLAKSIKASQLVAVVSSEAAGGARFELFSDGELLSALAIPSNGANQVNEVVATVNVDQLHVVVPSGGAVEISGITLLDSKDIQYPVSLFLDQGIDLISWTDVKLYELHDMPPRVSLLTDFGLAGGPEGSVSMMQANGGVDSRQAVVLELSDGLEERPTPILSGIANGLRAANFLPRKGRIGVVDGVMQADLMTLSKPVANQDGWYRLPPVNAHFDISQYEAEAVGLTVFTTGPALVILRDAIYPGWIATVDNVEVPVLRGNLLHRVVLVPAGKHFIQFKYAPPEFFAGWIVSSVTVLVSVLLLVINCVIPRYRRAKSCE